MFVNRRTVKIEWGDCDPAGIVFYPRYFAMFDASTHALFEAAGWSKQQMIREFDIVGCPMVDTRARFLIPSSFGDEIVTESGIVKFRNSSFDIEHKTFKGESLAIEAWETRVWTARDPAHPSRLKSRPVPERFIRRLTGEGGTD
jgi:4-hydroxybenzoyl-CoA thioesterase